MIHSIETVTFKRGKTQEEANANPLEQGILLNQGDLNLIDSNGLPVEQVWRLDRYHGLSIHDLSIGKEETKETDLISM